MISEVPPEMLPDAEEEAWLEEQLLETEKMAQAGKQKGSRGGGQAPRVKGVWSLSSCSIKSKEQHNLVIYATDHRRQVIRRPRHKAQRSGAIRIPQNAAYTHTYIQTHASCI